MKPNKKPDISSENMSTSKNMSTDAFTYVTWAILILSPLYVLYFLYSLATGGSIIYTTIPSVISSWLE
ncbi:hypothetical protein [Methanosarcina sp. UBA5]|uniref:hypothetical protein n=1 Tax=Methanosarcina sp. UBA5 TaxID=1915593 RepID=UPI0025F03E47|nr:hypothetical protein [Methanosarcina sp. UBA5]